MQAHNDIFECSGLYKYVQRCENLFFLIKLWRENSNSNDRIYKWYLRPFLAHFQTLCLDWCNSSGWKNSNYCTASFMIVINRSIFYTAFILQPYVHILLSSPSFFIQWNEIQNAYDYQCSGIKKKHLLCTQFSWVYCAMHNCNRGCIKLRRSKAFQSHKSVLR